MYKLEKLNNSTINLAENGGYTEISLLDNNGLKIHGGIMAIVTKVEDASDLENLKLEEHAKKLIQNLNNIESGKIKNINSYRLFLSKLIDENIFIKNTNLLSYALELGIIKLTGND